MGSGIIYAALILLWAAYFIPRWLKRHEELSESRSVEKFDAAMKILSRKDPTPDQRRVVMPRRPDAPTRTLPARTPVPAPRSASRVRRRTTPAMRRRRILAGLVLTTFVTTVLAPFTPLPWWVPLVTFVLVVADLVHLRLQVRSSREVSRSREAVRRSMASRLVRFDALDRLMAVRRELAEERAAENARWAAAEEAEARLREEEERRSAEEAGQWEPVPVPLPTYVSKPPAPRKAPPIDLTHPGAWSEAQIAGARAVDQDAAAPAGRSSMSQLVEDADEADDQLGAILERRAVND